MLKNEGVGIYIKSNVRLHLSTIFILYALAGAKDLSVLVSITSVLAVIFMLFNNIEFDFYLFIGLVGFEYFTQIVDKNIIFIYFLIAAIKIVINQGKVPYLSIFSILLILLLQTINDLGNIPILNFVNTSMVIIYFFLVISIFGKMNLKYSYCIYSFVISYICMILGTIFSYPSIQDFLMSVSSEYIIRFGSTSREITGGAMSIPLYSSLIIGLLLSYLIIKVHSISKFKSLGIIFICIIALFFGLITISRVFLLCMGVILLCILLSILSYDRFKSIKIFSGVLFLILTLYITNKDWINNIILKFNIRNQQEGGVGKRELIYQDSIEYLFNNPIRLIFGSGIKNYSNIGEKYDKYFSFTAHNLFLDILMGIGVIGLIVFVISIFWICKVLRMEFKGNINIINFIPLIIFIIYSLTATSLAEVKTYIYILFLLYHAFAVNNMTELVTLKEINR